MHEHILVRNNTKFLLWYNLLPVLLEYHNIFEGFYYQRIHKNKYDTFKSGDLDSNLVLTLFKLYYLMEIAHCVFSC